MRAIAIALILLCSTAASASGYGRSANFLVHAPQMATHEESQAFADKVVTAAEQYRKEIAIEWFGRELPDGAGRSVINIDFNRGGTTDGVTWAIDDPRRTLHMIWLKTPNKQDITGGLLKHEICHAVFATFHASPRVPKDLEERIALTYNAAKPEPVPRLTAELSRWENTK